MCMRKHRPIRLHECGMSRHPQVRMHIARRLACGIDQAEAKRISRIRTSDPGADPKSCV